MKYALFGLSLGLSLIACQGRETLTGERITAIINVTVIDPLQGQQDNMNVVIIDDKIQSVSQAPIGALKADTITQIDGSGKYLIPGLWDAHVHLTYTEGLDHRTFFPLSIAHGVTSLRDIGGHLDKLVEARTLSANDDTQPNLYVSGPLIDGPEPVYDGRSTSNPNLAVGVANPSEAEAQVEALAAQGVDFIKAYEMLSPESFRAITAKAKSLGLPVAAHPPLSMSAIEAAKAGASDFQHLRNLELNCAANSDELQSERIKMLAAKAAPDAGKLRSSIHKAQRSGAVANQSKENCDALIQTLAENNVFQTPTFTINRFLTKPAYKSDTFRETFKYIPPAIGKGWEERSAKLLQFAPDKAALAFDAWGLSMIPRLRDAGVPIMAGTDAPIAFLTPGASLHAELGMLVDAGLSPLEALKAATYTPATFFGIETQTGTITAGMTADLVLLNENPLDSIKNISVIETVIKHGYVLDRTELNKRLSAPSKIMKNGHSKRDY